MSLHIIYSGAIQVVEVIPAKFPGCRAILCFSWSAYTASLLGSLDHSLVVLLGKAHVTQEFRVHLQRNIRTCNVGNQNTSDKVQCDSYNRLNIYNSLDVRRIII